MDMFDFASKHVESIIQMMSTNFITFILIFSGLMVWRQFSRRTSRKTHVAIDLSFSKEMCLKELISLRKQIKLCYSLSRKRESKILVASFEEEKLPRMDKLNYRNWRQSAVEFVRENVETMKGPWSEIVYLSPDAEETLNDVRGDVLYVIGGIVDKVVKRNMSLNRATAMNAKTVKFPLREYLIRRGSEKTTKTELNIDTAYDILLRRRQGETWDKIFDDVLPRRRKGISYEISYSELNTTMPVEFTEEQVKNMNKREMARHNFKAYLLDSLYALKNGTTASFDTVFTKSTVNHERFRSDLIVKNAAGKILYHENAYGRSIKSAESVASWYVLRHLPEFFVNHRERISSRAREKKAARKRSKTPVRKEKKA